MSGDSEADGLAEIFRGHFGHRDHLYGVLPDALADDLESGGPTAQICRNHLDATRGEAIQLRLLAAIFRIVLRGDAPQLARFYPCLGGTASPEAAWQSLRPLLVAHEEDLRASLNKPPQTNEVGRAACLAIGLFEAVPRHGVRRVRLLESGAAAGLNVPARLVGVLPLRKLADAFDKIRKYAQLRLALFIAKRQQRGRAFGYAMVYRSPTALGLINLNGTVIAPRPNQPWRAPVEHRR